VRDGVLCRYFYRPHVVELAAEEHAEWRTISSEISKLYARRAAGDGVDGLDDRIQRLLLKRARIVKHAAGKVPLAVSVIGQSYKPGQRWIVYCDDLEQLSAVSQALAQAGHDNLPFHSQMEGDRASTLRWLERRGGIVVAIRCLDEGVDVPSVTHALILASSKNPREYIQRRGRVLRIHPGKSLAHVHDAIVVLPPAGLEEDGLVRSDPVTAGEIARALEFASHADNPAAGADLRQIAISARLDWRTLVGQGVEDVDD
jgi:superfamily II DNA or RNA helicase